MDSVDEKIDKTFLTEKKSILCIVPLPPPITGPAVVSETIVNYLQEHYDVVVIKYQRGNLESGKFSLRQVFRILNIGLKLIRFRLTNRSSRYIYLVISTTFWGNMRDLFFLTVMGSDLRKKLVIHLHGANLGTYLNNASKSVRLANKIMLKDVKAAIVLGKTLQNNFDRYIPKDRIRIIENYYEPSLLIPHDQLILKFASVETVNILFLSNLIKDKGYEILLDAFLSLPSEVSAKSRLHYVGEIYSSDEKNAFKEKIKNNPNIVYHGPLTGEPKRNMFWSSHIFCLPTVHRYEGQPLSIIEAYASGCIVLTTNNGGIKDIFVNGENGFFVGNDDLEIDIESFKERLQMLILNIYKYKEIAEMNRFVAYNTYKKDNFIQKIEKVLFE